MRGRLDPCGWLNVSGDEVHGVGDADLQPLRRSISSEFGDIRSVRAVGRLPGTWVVQTYRQRLVVKRMGVDRSREEYRRLLANLHASSSWPVPHLLDACDGDGCWYALFEYMDGTVGVVPSTIWHQAGLLLQRLSVATPVEPLCALIPLWLDRLQKAELADPSAEKLLVQMMRRRPGGPVVFAHGDFSPQNFCVSHQRLSVIDLEEAGTAPLGFDAGWLLALHRVGALHGFDDSTFLQTLDASAPAKNLNWYEGLGLLRLLYRCRTLTMDAEARDLAILRVSRSLREFIRTAVAPYWRRGEPW